MLTESEREWMEDREWFLHPYTCKWCDRYDPLLFFPANKSIPCKWYQSCTSLNCPSQSDLQDAAAFEGRVTAKLAELFANISLAGNATEFDCESSCPAFSMCCTILREGLPCDDAILMYARLAVEEEMDEQAQT